MPNAIPVQRGCGTRTKGAAYWETGFDPRGLPLEDFIMDPPVPIDHVIMGISPIGVKLVPDRNGTWHIFDWVGENFYPDVAGFLEEVRRYGVSRKLPSTLEFDKLTRDSRLILLHPRAYIENFDDYMEHPAWSGCATGKPEHNNPKEHEHTCCAGVWWDDVQDGVPIAPQSEAPRLVTVKMPAFEFVAQTAPENVKPVYRLAIFARFPLTRIVVVRDPETGRHNDIMQKIQKAGHRPDLVDQ